MRPKLARNIAVMLVPFSKSNIFAASFVASTSTSTAGYLNRESPFGNLRCTAFSSSSFKTSHRATSLEVSSVTRNMEGPVLPSMSSTTKRLFLVRHGEVINPGNDRPVYYGAMDVSLSKLGKLEAKAAGDYLSQFNLQHVAASPLSRAMYGGNKVIVNQKDKEESDLKIYEGFKELDRGSWAMKTKSEIGLEDLAKFDACDESVTPEGGESYIELKKRVLAARDKVLDITDCGKASVIVSHLQVTRSMLSDALGVETAKMAGLKIATASVTCIDYDVVSGDQTVHFQSFKPDVGLEKSVDVVN